MWNHVKVLQKKGFHNLKNKNLVMNGLKSR